MLIKLDVLFTFALSLTKVKSLKSRKIQNCEGQNVRQYQANLEIELMYEAANYKHRVY